MKSQPGKKLWVVVYCLIVVGSMYAIRGGFLWLMNWYFGLGITLGWGIIGLIVYSRIDRLGERVSKQAIAAYDNEYLLKREPRERSPLN